MIIVKLMGGLGNQMFEYACGRALSIKLNTQLKLDLSYLKREWLERLKGNPIRLYSLQIFNIQEEFAKPYELPPLAWFPGTRLTKVVNHFSQLISPNAPVIMRAIPFDLNASLAQLASASPHTYLDGFWQSEEYFKSVKETIQREFTFKQELKNRNLELAHQIKTCNSVSVHIRRDDYVWHPIHSRFFAECKPDYYHNAIAFIEKQIENPHFFVFSDGLAWPKQNLIFGKQPVTFVEHNLGTGLYYEDLRLMSLCQHNIIANSSFSWWGAWLNQNPKKIVLAPKRWFKANVSSAGFIPAGWIEIENQLV